MTVIKRFSDNQANMPEIDRLLFRGTEQLTAEDWATVTATDLSSRTVGQLLGKYGWEGKAAATTGIRLKPDNTGPEAARLMLLGTWDSTLKIQAKKVFAEADQDTMLEIELDNLAVFRFNEGSMASRYTPQEAVKYRLIQGERVLRDEDDRMAQGIGDFSLRIIAGLSKACGVKYGLWLQLTVLIFHLSAEHMIDQEVMPKAEDPAWPGVKLVEGQVPILPLAWKKRQLFGGKDWGAPICPIITTGVPWEAAPGPLDQKEVIEACRSLLNKGTAADSSPTVEAMLKKWERPQPVGKPAEKEWPGPEVAAEKPKAKKGNGKFFLVFKWNI